ncbi:MAG: calcium-binding protein [Methylotenera sp.]|nr:MAG: calcium-binding protein [Methylotenera sp.]
MAIKIFNATETEYTGTAEADLIIGNNLGNFIDAGEGNNIVLGGGGNDEIFAGSGNNLISGGSGDDTIVAGDGNNWLSGDNGNDFIGAGAGDDTVYGGNGNDQILVGDGDNYVDAGAGDDYIGTGEGDDTIYAGLGNDIIEAGEGDDILSGGDGIDLISGGGSTAGDETVDGNLFIVTTNDNLLGGEGNDTFVIGEEEDATGVTILGGVSELDNEGEEARYTDFEDDDGTVYDNVTNTRVEIEDLEMAEEAATDVRINIVTRPGSTAISTFASSIAGYNAVDTLEFTQSGEFEGIEFAGIERIELASGVNITLEAEQLLENGETTGNEFLNAGTHIYGVAGGPKETVTLELEYEDVDFVPAATIVGATAVTYSASELQFDDYSVAELFHNVDMIYDASEGLAGSYVRIDGANESAGASETVEGSEGVDNATMRLGNDTYHGNGGNDLLIGHGGADKLYGDAGNDIFVISSFGSGTQGTASKADDGNAEWVAGDLIVGGAGVDTLRITTGIGAIAGNNTIMLNNANFQSMEVVQVGGTAGRLNVEDSALQLLNDHYYHRANSSVADLSNTLGNNGGSINNVVVNASGVTTNGLRFEGNANTNTFIGTSKADVFVGNGGNDTLTGGGGADKFVFGKVYEQIVTGAATAPQSYVNTAFNLTGVDTITDFLHGTDKIELHLDQYTNLAGFSAANLVSSASGVAADANDYLLFNTTSKMLSYDADGNGAGAAINIATLMGVTTFTASDVVVV